MLESNKQALFNENGTALSQEKQKHNECCNNIVYVKVPDNGETKKTDSRVKLIYGLLGALVLVAGISGYCLGISVSSHSDQIMQDPTIPPPPSWSKLHKYDKAAICTDAPTCSDIGNQMLSRNGSAVDAAIAAMFCNSMMNMQSVGMGGGHFMTVYIKNERKAYAVVGREKAPKAAEVGMFKGKAYLSEIGPLAVGVPGEVRGLWTAHNRWGVLPWSELLAPSIALCRSGYKLSKPTHSGLISSPYVMNDLHLRKMFFNERTKSIHPPGTLVKPPVEYCRTLERLAEEGGDSLYNGTLAQDLADDFKKAKTILTAEDLIEYEAKIVEPIAVPLGEYTLYTPPPPSSGVLLVYILNILSGYKISPDSVSTPEKTTLTYHRIVEAFKYAYATRTKLGDMDYLDLKDLINNVTSVEYGKATRMLINEAKTSNITQDYGAEEYTKDDAGTAQMSIIAPNGDAVSVTSSINGYFGCGLSGAKTGIVFNNVMDDFASPGLTNSFGVEPSPANFIAPGKMPLSSMVPSIIVDNNGNVRLVVGASGGTKITTATALVTIKKLWLQETLKEAVDAPRIHHQLLPMAVQYEYGTTQDLLNGLRDKGHGVVRFSAGSVVCALYRNETAIYGNADYRKGGDVCGI